MNFIVNNNIVMKSKLIYKCAKQCVLARPPPILLITFNPRTSSSVESNGTARHTTARDGSTWGGAARIN